MLAVPPTKEAVMKTAKSRFPILSGSVLLMALAALGCRDGANPVSTARARALTLDDPALTQVAFAQEVCGVLPATLIITENTRLTCDVQCLETSGPCIQFGKDNITLSLAGFTMTGTASPPASCAPSPGAGPAPNPGAYPYDGISTAGHDRVRIRGPGMVQKFRRHGIFMFVTDNAIVENVTSHYNCYSGIFLGLSHENFLSENASVRNGSASAGAPCGGNCVTNSNGNRIRRNHFHGNGSVAPGGPPLAGIPNDFGVGLVGTSSGNVVEENSIGGNINGILLYPATAGNLIRHNLIAGNPPVQVEVSAGTLVGYDIRDASAAGANTFQDNHCVTYLGASFESGNNAGGASDGSPAKPCPNFPRARGHN